MAIGRPHPPLLRIFLFSHPRTGSSLFCKLFSEHPNINHHLYGFLDARYRGPEAQEIMTEEEKEKFCKSNQPTAFSFQEAFDHMQTQIAQIEATGKVPFLKDHCIFITRASEVYAMLPGYQDALPEPNVVDKMLDISSEVRTNMTSVSSHINPTILPDRFLETMTPVITIRHPIKQVESYYKITRVDPDRPHWEVELHVSYKFSRRIFDYFRELHHVRSKHNTNGNYCNWPIVIDGDDLINNTEGLATKFCEVTGLDPDGIAYQWEAEVPMEPYHPIEHGTLFKSKGVIKNVNPKPPGIAESSRKWEATWGQDAARTLEKYVREAMDDYEYLYQFSLQA